MRTRISLKDGGYAFAKGKSNPPYQDGMTMRQYYKAAALEGMHLPVYDRNDGPPSKLMEWAANAAWSAGVIADAMLMEDAEHEATLEEKQHD
jgi:hypothetical protein